jgi:hypothetical protein
MPAALTKLARRFGQWRRRNPLGERIPQRLWDSAVEMARLHGLSRTATALGLGYQSLKKRIEEAPVHDGDSPARSREAGFVERPAWSLAGSAECLVELEKQGGSGIGVQRKGIALNPAMLSRAVSDAG